MALDAGSVTPMTSTPVRASPASTPLASAPSGAAPGAAPQTIGMRLRTEREAQGRTLQQLADVTRVRRRFLTAIEDMRPDLLPSRPFAVGYAKAYARALGLDAEEAAERFRNELPGAEPATLRAPIGVERASATHRRLMMGAGASLVAVLLLWNVAQRAVAYREPALLGAPEPPAEWLNAAPITVPVPLSPPTPAPAEQSRPPPYATPGLEAFAARQAAAAADKATPSEPASAAPPAFPLARAGAPGRAVFGEGPAEATVTLTARRAASLIVRQGDGRIVFARHLAAGESWRSPPRPGLAVEVSEPSAWDVYALGAFKGQMSAPTATLAKLAG